MKPFKMIILFTLYMLSCSCYHFKNDPSLATPASILPQHLIKDFSYPQNTNPLVIAEQSETGHYKLTHYRLKSSQDLLNPQNSPHEISFEVYKPDEELHKATIISLPISGGNYLVSRYFAEYFAKRGYTSVVIHRRKAYKNMITVDNLNTIIRQMMTDHMQVMDKLVKEKISITDQFAVLGVSKGGLKTAILAPLDKRVKAAIVVIAGGNLPYILSESEESGVKKRRLKYLEKTGMAVTGFHDQLKKNLKYDPLDLAPYFDSSKLMIVNAYFDNCVPYKSGKLLVESHKGCEEILLIAGHYSALPAIPYLSIKFKKFLTEKLP